MLRRTAIFFVIFLLVFPRTVRADDTPSVSAAAAIVTDMDSGMVMYAKNEDAEHAVASTTKLMTCLLACESGKLNETATVTAAMLTGLEGTSLNLKAGDRITVLDLVRGAMLASGNDAANVIAYTVCETPEEFVERMNEKALLLGMHHTHFSTPSGLDIGDNHSSAGDMALLAAAVMNNGTLAEIASLQRCDITVNDVKRRVVNHNRLLSADENFVGLKTGYTKKAGRCLVSAYRYRGNTLLCVTLNDPDDWEDHVKLTEFAKNFYQRVDSEKSAVIPLVGSVSSDVKASCQFSAEACGDVTAKVYYYPFAYVPVYTGDVLGYAEIYNGNRLLCTVELTADETVTG